MKPRAWLKISVGLLAATFAALPIAQEAQVNVVYINGIQNTMATAESTRMAIEAKLALSEGYAGSSRRNFRVEAIYNPTGWYGESSAGRLVLYRQDLKELFLLKTSEEIFSDAMALILLPHDQPGEVAVTSAEVVRQHLVNMMPGPNVTSLEAGSAPEMTDADMAGTQAAAFSLAAKVRSLGSAVVVAHSQGNLLANLAWANLAVQYGNRVGNVMRVVNVANTSKFSVNGLNLTHAGDFALFSTGLLSFNPGLEALPTMQGWTRSTPHTNRCGSQACGFVLAAPTFQRYRGDIDYPNSIAGRADAVLHHFVTSTYLNDQAGVTIDESSPGGPRNVGFPSGKRFVDRFVDFVYAAADALGRPPLPEPGSGAPQIAAGGQPASVTAGVGTVATFRVVATGTAPLVYQWRRNGAAVPCSSSVDCSNLSWSVGAADDGAQFSVIVSNSAGSVTSNSALLNVSVTPPPTANCGPQSVTWSQGASTCNATYGGGQSGTSVLLSDLAAPTTGTVTASCTAGVLSQTSPACATAPTPPPGLISPTSLAPSGTITSLTPVFSWSGGSGAANYEINVSDQTTGTIVFRQPGISTASNSFTMPAGILVNARQYRWDITACPNFACSSGYVTSVDLTFVTQAPPPTAPDLIAQGVVFEPSTITVGGMTLVTFSVTNTGTATSSASEAAVRITPAAATDPGSTNVRSVPIPGIAAGGSVVRTVGVSVPTADGAYKVWVVADWNGAAGQSTATRANDAAAAPLALTVVPRVIPLGGTAEGVYGGTMTGGPNPNFRMLVLEDGEFWSLYGVNVGGQLSVGGFIQGRAASGGGSLSATDVKDFGFFPAVGGGTIAGTFDAAAGTLQANVRFPGLTVNVVGGPVRDVPYEYNQPASLADFVGNWSLVANTGDRISLNIAATGAMTATSAFGCSFTGTVTPRPSGKNVFNASLQFGTSPCLLPGQRMTGVAVAHRLQDGRTQLTFAGVNAARTAGLMAAGTR